MNLSCAPLASLSYFLSLTHSDGLVSIDHVCPFLIVPPNITPICLHTQWQVAIDLQRSRSSFFDEMDYSLLLLLKLVVLASSPAPAFMSIFGSVSLSIWLQSHVCFSPAATPSAGKVMCGSRDRTAPHCCTQCPEESP